MITPLHCSCSVYNTMFNGVGDVCKVCGVAKVHGLPAFKKYQDKDKISAVVKK